MTQVTTGQSAPPGSARDTILTFGKSTDKGTTYKSMGTFPYPGALKVGTPSRVVAIGGVETAGSMDIRLYDVKAATVIAEVLGVVGAYPSEIDLGAISNVLQGPSVWELQYRRASGSGNQTVSLSSATLEY